MLYHALDIFFVIFHTLLILFNLFGWVWRKTRIANLVTLLLTGSSWLILGLIVGTLGYCPLTDWHFRILEKLGKNDLPYSYVKYLADRITGLNFDPVIIDKVTLYAFLAALAVSIIINIRDLYIRRVKSINLKGR
ncbi:MAG: DUF2784 domain-containing protein [Bacteroidota bacterium]|nr:DUF2784 domain-containing protein [Bacteroidota bacterium]